jgi:hypothetical protein
MGEGAGLAECKECREVFFNQAEGGRRQALGKKRSRQKASGNLKFPFLLIKSSYLFPKCTIFAA